MKFTKIVLWIVGVALVVIAPIQLYRIHRAFGSITSGAVLFLILPAILMTGMAFIVKKWPTNKILESLGVVALGLTLLWYIPLTFGIEAWISAEPVSDVGKYKKILTKWKQSAPDIVSHFPESIPPDAQDVDFYFSPGFLQADSEIQLRFKTTPKNIEEYYERFSKLATKTYRGKEFVHFLPHQQMGKAIEFGKDFEVLQFNQDTNNIPEHGKEHGVIISKEKNEIIFWAEW